MSVKLPSFEPIKAEKEPRLKVALALGAGGALGCAHIGVIRALQELGVHINAVAGSSMGAIVGAFLATGKLKELEDFLKEVTLLNMLEYGNFSLRSEGWVKSQKLEDLLNDRLGGVHIEDMAMPYAAVAMEWRNWEPVLLNTGNAAAAAVASSSIPGVFPKKQHQGQTLVDGGFTNMVPVFAARKLSDEKVIAVGVARGYPLVQKARRQITRVQWEKHRPSLGQKYNPDVDLFLSLDHGGGARYDNAQKFIEAGYRFVMKNRQVILSALAA